MLHALVWVFIIEVFGVIALPIAMRLFRYLPDRGYAFAKALGLLLTSYTLWILSSFGILRNEAISILAIMVLLAAISWHLYRRSKEEIATFLRAKAKLILTVEVLFLVSYAVWALFRAYNPELDATERPMDLGFLNAILRSERFPPNDPWLSGFAISYYYFGYLMMAVVTKLSGIPSAIAFNLAIAFLFASTMLGSFSLVYNLIEKAKAAKESDAKPSSQRGSVLFGILGAFLVVVIGNLHVAFDALHARGLGSDAFWSWLDLKKVADAPVTGRWIPTDPPDGWWWWRSSRVIHDRDLLGRDSEVIDEFPFFSFLLGDMHPHVLGLPFVLLALGLAMNALFGFLPAGEPEEGQEPPEGLGFIAQLVKRALGTLRANAFDISLWALCLGGLAFLNTWDFPIYLFIFVAALSLRRHMSRQRIDWIEIVIYAGWIFGLGVLLYLPFYLGFRSQAGGILPVLYNITRLPQYLIMFGLFSFCLVSLIVSQWRELAGVTKADGTRWLEIKPILSTALQILLGIVLLPVLGFSLAIFVVTSTGSGRAFVQELMAHPDVQSAVGGQTVGALVQRFALMRLQDPWLFLILVGAVTAMIILIWQRLRWAKARQNESEDEQRPSELIANTSLIFVTLIATVGLLLTLVTEFVYLRDFFGTRMNTIFKFWYQAWVQMAIASAFAAWYITRHGHLRWRASKIGRYVWTGAFIILVALSLLYPGAAMYSKAHQFSVEPTLNGIAYMQRYRPADYAAIQWFQENVKGSPFILEAPGGSYSQYGRISSQTGLPTVLGWDFHEQQWRGNYDEPGKRAPDIEKIYKSTDEKLVADLIDQYDIEYVYVGDLERSKYGLQPQMIRKFDRLMDKVYDQDGVLIYQR